MPARSISVLAAVSEAFNVHQAELLTSRRHGNEGRAAAICLARSLTDAAVGAIGRYFGGVSAAAVSKAVQRAEDRRSNDRHWNRRLAKLAACLTSPSGDAARKS